MKRLLRLFTLLAVNIIGQTALAATDYGIRVGQVSITSDNANKVTGTYIKEGSVSYDSSTNTLTLWNALIDCENAGGSSGIAVTSSAQNGLHIVLKGVNTIRNCNGADVLIYKKSGYTNTTSQPNVYIQGTGSLTLEQRGSSGGHIMCMDGVNLCFGDFTMGGQGYGGCTVNARCIYSRDNGGGYLWLSDANINLTGFSYTSGGVVKGGTIYGFTNAVSRSGYCQYYLPSGNTASYDTASLYMKDGSGQRLTTSLYAGWKKYGLRVGGVDVTYGNRDHITSPVTSPSPAISRTVSYNPDTHTLTLDEATIQNYDASPVVLNETGYPLTISSVGTSASTIANRTGNTAISSPQSLTFTGSAQLTVTCGNYTTINVPAAIQITGTGDISMKNSDLLVTGGIDCNGGALNLTSCYLSVTSGSDGVKAGSCTMTQCAVRSKGVCFNETRGCFCSQNGSSTTQVIIAPVTASYGIYLGGHEVNDITADNFCFSNIHGAVSYDPQSNTLKLRDVTVDCLNKYNALQVRKDAAANLRIELEGESTLKNIMGVGMYVYNNAVVAGGGSLTFEDGSINAVEGSSLAFAGGCTVNATRLVGRNDNGGTLYTTDCTLNLTGSGGYATIAGFSELKAGTPIAYPAKAVYDTADKRLKLNGYSWTGRVEVHEVTVGDITDLINEYLEGSGGITIEDITNLIGLYLDADMGDSRAVDLGLSVMWAGMNVGASAPEDCGHYFAYGETEPKATYSWDTYKWWSAEQGGPSKYNPDSLAGGIPHYKYTLDLADDAAYTNWGAPWRMPTYDELDELMNSCTWAWTTQNGMNGYRVTGPNGNSIFLPAAGHYSSSWPSSIGMTGNYRSSAVTSTSPSNAYGLKFNAYSYDMEYYYRYYGQSVRPVCQPGAELTVPLSRIVLYDLDLVLGESGYTPIAFYPLNASSSSVSWSSSDSRVATVGTDGLVTAHSVGTATLTATATDGSGVKGSCTIRVIEGTTTYTVYGVDFNMVSVSGGTFLMGAQKTDSSSPNYDADAYSEEAPVHSVTLSDYQIGETEVTQALWKAVMGSNPSSWKYDNRPVVNVSWDDCQTFITKLNQLTGKTFRLPTEAEWEFAARGGRQSKGYKYSGSNTADDVAWYRDNSGSETHAVGTKRANELGLYDMTGNVDEFCSDWYASYDSSAQSNPTGPTTGSTHVLRGGNWYGTARDCRVTDRGSVSPTVGYNLWGLRLALSPSSK